ncbi:MAG: 30S ribosomal protein S8 [Candidatus Levybacteria bacterium]|nr:30S ribosomal protein S8 [Candidatus Levybacteria bacterium]
MNYKIADFIIRIKNAALAKRRELELPFSNINREIGKILVKRKILEDLNEKTTDGKKTLLARIKYIKRTPVLTDVLIVSKPSLRVYVRASKIAEIERKGFNTVVISTSKGIMTGEEARKKGLGGELLFKVW